MESLGKMMTRYRAIHGMTQGDLAKKVGVDRVTINNAENGKNVSKVTEAKIELVIYGED